jgi:hypothetical protein
MPHLRGSRGWSFHPAFASAIGEACGSLDERRFLFLALVGYL